MAELKTNPRKDDVHAFIEAISDPGRREDCSRIVEMMSQATTAEPALWGDSIVGFGTYHYVYESGREGDWFLTGFSPRKQNITLYIMMGFERYAELMSRLGKYKTGKSCLYIKRLADVDVGVLKQLIDESVHHLKVTKL